MGTAPVHPILLWLTKVIMKDFAIKTGIVGVDASIWSGTADTAVGQLAKYGSAMLSAPRKKSSVFTKDSK